MLLKKWALLALALSFALTGLLGCVMNGKDSPDGEQNVFGTVTEETHRENEDDKYHGFSLYDISSYQRVRTYEIMSENGFDDYTDVGTQRRYSCTAEELREIEELDETYLYGFYTSTTTDTLTNVCITLGYRDLDDFLVKKGYVDSNGEPSTMVWCQRNSVEISEIMARHKSEITAKD